MQFKPLQSCTPRRGRHHLQPSVVRFAGDHSPGRAGAGALRIVTFNLKFGRHVDRTVELLNGSDILQKIDVLALQEMDEEGVEKIARHVGLNYVYYPALIHKAHGRNFGNAVLSPWAIMEDQKILLPHPGKLHRAQRIAVAGTLAVGNQHLRVYSLHLGTALEIRPGQRRAQVEAILEHAEGFAGPVILVGDMNARGIGHFLEKRGYFWATKPVRRTISLFAWDHIFVRGLEANRVREVGVVRNNGKASDHKPVWITVCLDGSHSLCAPSAGPTLL